MADQTATNDTSVSEEVKTSTNEADSDTDVALENIEVTEADLEEPADEENDEYEPAPAQSDTSKDEDEADDTDSEEDDEPTNQAQGKPKSEDVEEAQPQEELSKEEQKRRNDEYARQRIAEREAREAAKREAQAQYLQQAEDDKDLALRQLQVAAYNNNIQFNEQRLQNGLEKAVASIKELREGSPEVKEFLVNSMEEFERLYVTKDANGDPVEVRHDPYQYLATKAAEARKLTGVGARKQEESKAGVKARTMAPPSRAPKEPKVDPDLADFDAEFDKYK